MNKENANQGFDLEFKFEIDM